MLIDMVNKACEEENGSVVCIEGGRNLTYNIKYAARLVDICEYPIAAGVDAFFAFVCAIYSQNFRHYAYGFGGQPSEGCAHRRFV